jgi:hypothetical protein
MLDDMFPVLDLTKKRRGPEPSPNPGLMVANTPLLFIFSVSTCNFTLRWR